MTSSVPAGVLARRARRRRRRVVLVVAAMLCTIAAGVALWLWSSRACCGPDQLPQPPASTTPAGDVSSTPTLPQLLDPTDALGTGAELTTQVALSEVATAASEVAAVALLDGVPPGSPQLWDGYGFERVVEVPSGACVTASSTVSVVVNFNESPPRLEPTASC